ncbi:MAG: hypothetical protein QNJ40_01370 [Xanthomonadales bacterium]|nr:hypothetical protein [Xanthomonadales bacterium]
MMIRKFNGIFMLSLLAAVAWSPAWAEPVAMVTDLTGDAQRGGESLSILSDLGVGDVVAVSEQSVVHVVYYAESREFVFRGPAEFEVGPAEPKTLSGAEPNSQSMMPEGEGSISTVGLAQAAMVMRAAPNEARLELNFPVETMLLEAPASFSWAELAAGIGYAFELTDGEGRSLLESIVNGTSLQLPAHIDLKPGEYYTWSLETRLPDGRKFSSWASFSVADEALKTRVNDIRPGDDASVSRLVVFALWLEQNELLSEAQVYWARAGEVRPSLKSRVN